MRIAKPDYVPLSEFSKFAIFLGQPAVIRENKGKSGDSYGIQWKGDNPPDAATLLQKWKEYQDSRVDAMIGNMEDSFIESLVSKYSFYQRQIFPQKALEHILYTHLRSTLTALGITEDKYLPLMTARSARGGMSMADIAADWGATHKFLAQSVGHFEGIMDDLNGQMARLNSSDPAYLTDLQAIIDTLTAEMVQYANDRRTQAENR